MKNKKLVLVIAVLIIFHAVGFYGLGFSTNPAWYQDLTPLNLLLTIIILFSFHKSWNTTFLIFATIVMLVGFFAEIIGIHTGLLFGNYQYGNSLGLKLWEVPLLIALNWLLLVYITGVLVQSVSVHWLLKALIAAFLMVLLDMFIEPVAAVLDYWTWQNYQIPAGNYWGWLGVGFGLQLYFQKVNIKKQNPLAAVIYLLQLLFFIGLNLVL